MEWKPCRVFPSEIHVVSMTWGRIFGEVKKKKPLQKKQQWESGWVLNTDLLGASDRKLFPHNVCQLGISLWQHGLQVLKLHERKKGRKGGNIVFIFHRSWWTTAAVHHTSSPDTSSKITPADFNKTMASLFAHVRIMLFIKKCVDKKKYCYHNMLLDLKCSDFYQKNCLSK